MLLGPVFMYERLTASRRWQYYALRSFGMSALLVAMGAVAYSEDAFFEGKSVEEYSRLGQSYFIAMTAVELALVLLAAPAATAGAICLDRSRGTLEHLMTTDVSDAEIVLGKLLARLLPAIGLVACCLPVLAISSLLGGVDALTLAKSFAVIAMAALVACSLALALSVWARRPFEVILAVYMIWSFLIAGPRAWDGLARMQLTAEPPEWMALLNPFHIAVTPLADPNAIDRVEYLGFLVGCLVLSGPFVLLAVRGLRPAVIGRRRPAGREFGVESLGRLLRRFPGPSLDGNPVLWREWRRARSPRLTLLLMLLIAATTVANALQAYNVSVSGTERDYLFQSEHGSVYIYLVTALLGGLVLAAVSPMSLSEERRRGSLDVLLTTPISSSAIVLGKWLSLYRVVPWLAIGPGLLALGLAAGEPIRRNSSALLSFGIDQGPDVVAAYRYYACGLVLATVLAHGALLISIGLALATWLRHESRAVGVSVAAFILLVVAWPLVCGRVMEPSLRRGEYLAIGAAVSPIYAVTAIVDQLRQPDFFWWPTLEDVGRCTIGVAFVSVTIIGATIATFDRKMGRMPPQPLPRKTNHRDTETPRKKTKRP